MTHSLTPTHQALRLFGFAYCVSSAFVICRSVADAVLLTRLGSEALPPMLLISAVVTGGVSVWWMRRNRHIPLQAVVRVTQIAAAGCTAALLILLQLQPESAVVIGALYLLAELRSGLNAILLAVLLNELTSPRADKRSFAFVNAGAPVAGVSMGILIGLEADVIPVSGLLAAACVLDGLAWAIARTLDPAVRVVSGVARLPSHNPPTIVVPSGPAETALSSRREAFATAILWLVVCKVTVLTLVSYEWKVFSGRAFPDEQDLTACFALFYAVIDAATVAVQLFVTRHLLNRTGLVLTLVLLPLYLSVLGIASLFTTDGTVLFWLLTLARGSMVLRRGLHDVVIQVFYGWLPTADRRTVVTLVMGLAKPLAEALTSAGILLLAALLPVRSFAWLWLPALVFWFVGVRRLVTAWRAVDNDPDSDN